MTVEDYEKWRKTRQSDESKSLIDYQKKGMGYKQMLGILSCMRRQWILLEKGYSTELIEDNIKENEKTRFRRKQSEIEEEIVIPVPEPVVVYD